MPCCAVQSFSGELEARVSELESLLRVTRAQLSETEAKLAAGFAEEVEARAAQVRCVCVCRWLHAPATTRMLSCVCVSTCQPPRLSTLHSTCAHFLPSPAAEPPLLLCLAASQHPNFKLDRWPRSWRLPVPSWRPTTA